MTLCTTHCTIFRYSVPTLRLLVILYTKSAGFVINAPKHQCLIHSMSDQLMNKQIENVVVAIYGNTNHFFEMPVVL